MSKIYFTEEHEWIKVEGDIATVGITDHAQEQLGDLVFVDLPDVGLVVAPGDDTVVVESVKAASDVFAPVAGEITKINSALGDNPALVNEGAESVGWLYEIKLSDTSQLDELMDLDGYKALIA